MSLRPCALGICALPILSMLLNPFRILTTSNNCLTTALFTKTDDLITDQSTAESLGSHDYAALQQMHGNRTIIVRHRIERTEQADGLITDQPNLVLTIRIADCQPLIIYAPNTNFVGLLHVGWKGLVCGAIPKFFETLHGLCNLQPATCLIGIGPCLCPTCSEFSNPLLELPGIPPDLINGKTANLRAWADRQPIAAGVMLDHIERMEDCTRCNPEKYWTYRGGDREAVKNGRTNVMACVLKK